jgi:WD40 repeat protein
VCCCCRQDGDGRVQALDDHEDSVYGLAWSVHDPWLFASMSYDGRVVVNKVPKNTKYKILI